MPEIFCELVFKNPTKDHLQFGCNDRSKMVYHISKDGTDLISDVVWDSIFYALLAQVPDDQEDLVRAHRMSDATAKAKLHATYALETAMTLRNHVTGKIGELEDLLTKIRRLMKETDENPSRKHPHLSLIQTHNEFLKSSFVKVEAHLNDVIGKEREVRRRSNPS